ncbi:MAG: DUF655 domain-containing protein [Candidatus Bathyarchaeia archaeon]
MSYSTVSDGSRAQDPRSAAPKMYEEYAYVLDYLPYGRATGDKASRSSSSVVQIIGETYFTLLEAQLKPGASAAILERVYIGKDSRDKILRVLGRINYNDLTATAKAELENVLEKLILDQEPRFISFFNNSSAVTPRMHSLELLPGIGKKLMWQIIGQREKRPFSSFKDFRERTGITEPIRILAKRISEELSGESKYRLFTRAP